MPQGNPTPLSALLRRRQNMSKELLSSSRRWPTSSAPITPASAPTSSSARLRRHHTRWVHLIAGMVTPKPPQLPARLPCHVRSRENDDGHAHFPVRDDQLKRRAGETLHPGETGVAHWRT